MASSKRNAATPRRNPLAACLATVLCTATLFASSADAATWQHKHDYRHPTRTHAPALTKDRLHKSAARNQAALLKLLHAKFGTHKAAISNGPMAVAAVTSCADSGPGTLRDAVANANSGDTIDLTGLACSTITLTTGAIATSLDDLTIDGPGAANLTIDANHNDRAFVHTGYGTLTINNTTIANGYYKYYRGSAVGGGCIITTGSLVLNGSTITGCYAGGGYFNSGGGSYSVGTTTLTNSTVSNNTVFGFAYYGYTVSTGGGVSAGGTLSLTGSTVTGNGAYGFAFNQTNYDFIRGGGVYGPSGGSIIRSTIDTNYAVYSGAGAGLVNGTVTISNSTIANNYSYDGVGGGVFTLFNSTTIGNSTIAGNYSFYAGGGVYNVLGPLELESTLIASNTSGDAANADFGYYNASYAPTGANNLIMSTTFSVPAGTLTGDPQLQPLANNGGPTQTMALVAGSPAIDTGNNVAAMSTDQRGTGFARVSGVAADIGAFELQQAAATTIPAPTLSEWALWLLAGAVGLLGLAGVARRRRGLRETS